MSFQYAKNTIYFPDAAEMRFSNDCATNFVFSGKTGIRKQKKGP
jgi:hypothetical protein